MVSPFLFLGCDKLNESCDKQCLRHEFEGQAAIFVCLGMCVECTNVLYHISNCILIYVIYDIMIILYNYITREFWESLLFHNPHRLSNQTKSLPKILGGSGPRPRFHIEMMGCFMSWVARPWNPNVLWAAGGHLCWSDETAGLEWNPRSSGLNWLGKGVASNPILDFCVWLHCFVVFFSLGCIHVYIDI